MKDKDGKEDAKEARVADNALPPWFYLFVLLGFIEDLREDPILLAASPSDFVGLGGLRFHHLRPKS